MRKLLLVMCLFLCPEVHAQQAVLQEGLALQYLVQQPADLSEHTPVLILLHGYGADERDLFELRSILPKNYLIVSPRAPYALQGGGYQWYEGTFINDRRDGRLEELTASRDKIGKFIAEIINKYKADRNAVYLVGFSQGAIMCYEVGLTTPGKVKGIGVLSGVVFPSLKPMIKNTTALKKLRIFVAHGNMDDRIKYKDGKESVDYLKGLGLNLEYHSYIRMRHTISNEVMSDLLKWLK